MTHDFVVCIVTNQCECVHMTLDFITVCIII